jgi:cell wall-associated NlpC family hydrolase
MPTPKGPLVKRAGVGLAVAAAIAGGTLVARDQLTSGAAQRSQTLSERNGTLQGLTHTGPIVKGHPFTPFLGPFALHPSKGQHQCGPAVRLMQGALKRKKFRHTPPRNCVGPATKKQIQAFQKSIHYKPSGVYNQATHQALVLRNGYTSRARQDLLYLAHKQVVARQRHNAAVAAAHFLLVGGSTLAYCQSGQRSFFPAWPRIPPCTDCSGTVIWVLYQAGVGPTVGYFGPGSSVGWTGTLAVQGRALKANEPLAAGDVVLYPSSSARGPPWGHAAIYVGHGQVVSHGSVGVKLLPFNYRTVGQVRRYIL